MGNISEYFERNAYKPKYTIGDRVFGYWNGVPFIGSVGNDSGKDNVSIHPDLPVKFDNKVNNIIIVKHSDIKQKLKEIE